jgi:PTH1 family peptidyl-tRNA hydrolase
MKLFVGLGNPGGQYAFNRHNVGFMAVDAIAAAHDFPAWRKRFSSLLSEGKLGEEPVLLFKPQTFMNESGRAVGETVRFYKLELGDVVVFHDELDLAPGKVRVKIGGGVAGHNGLKSLTGYVLRDFTKAEHQWLEPLLGAIAAEAPYLAEGANDKFQSRVAHAMRPESEEKDKPTPTKKTASSGKEPKAETKSAQPEGTLASKLRRWLGS